MTSIDFKQAEEYATFCIMCDRNGYQPMKAEDYFDIYNKEMELKLTKNLKQ